MMASRIAPISVSGSRKYSIQTEVSTSILSALTMANVLGIHIEPELSFGGLDLLDLLPAKIIPDGFLDGRRFAFRSGLFQELSQNLIIDGDGRSHGRSPLISIFYYDRR